METITTFITGLTALLVSVTALIVTLIKSKKEIEETLPQKIQKQCDIDMNIINRLENIKEVLKADRVQIYDFHNGIHYANGRSALKTSCSFEVIRSGIKGHQKELQSVPLSCIPIFIKTLLNSGELRINNLEEIKDKMPATYELKKSQEVASFFDIILSNKNKEPIGFLAIQYNEKDKAEFTKEEMNEILKLKFYIEENLEKMVTKK